MENSIDKLTLFPRPRYNASNIFIQQNTLFRVNFSDGNFIFYSNTNKLLNIKVNSALMFAFDEENKQAFVFSENPKKDSYILRRYEDNHLRFTAKPLADFIKKTLNIKTSSTSAFFKLSAAAVIKNYYHFTFFNTEKLF